MHDTQTLNSFLVSVDTQDPFSCQKQLVTKSLFFLSDVMVKVRMRNGILDVKVTLPSLLPLLPTWLAGKDAIFFILKMDDHNWKSFRFQYSTLSSYTFFYMYKQQVLSTSPSFKQAGARYCSGR